MTLYSDGVSSLRTLLRRAIPLVAALPLSLAATTPGSAQQAPNGIQSCSALTGTWTGSGATWSSTTSSGVGVTVNFASDAGAAFSAPVNDTMNTIDTWSETSVQGTASLATNLLWDTALEEGSGAADDGANNYVTVSFDTPVLNPILHIDRIGGIGQRTGDPNTTANTSRWTLTTAGASLTRLAGPAHFETLTSSFYRTPDVVTANNGESSLSSASGTGAGSVMVAGLHSSLAFTIDGLGPEGQGGDGIELVFCAPAVDRSDAPVSGTNYGEAVHTILNGVRLGALIDADAFSIASPNANGDGVDDDGAVIPPLTLGVAATISVDVVGSGGYLSGWIDWDNNGDFAGQTEGLLADVQDNGVGDTDLTVGRIGFSVTPALTASTGNTIARFRWSTTSGLDTTTAAPDGEVEDYVVSVSDGSGYSSPPFNGVCSEIPLDTQILRGDTGGRIFSTNTQTGGNTLLTTSPLFSGTINALASNPDSSVVYYGEQTTMYYWDVATDTHGTLANLSSFPEFSGGTLESGGAGYLNGILYVGSEDAGGDLEDVFAVVLSLDGKSVSNVHALGVVPAALADGYDFHATVDPNGLGDIVVIGDGASGTIYGSTVDGGTNVGAYWSFDLASKNWTLLSQSHAWAGGQVASDVNGVLYANIGTDLFQIDKSTGATIGSAASMGAVPVDLTGPFTMSACQPAVDYSDAPTSGLAPDGSNTNAYGDATHTISASILLGAANDAESNSIASTNADGDGVEDDGVTFPVLRQGESAVISVSVTQASANSGNLQGWIDWNGDGLFGAGEQIATDAKFASGTTGTIDVTVAVPVDAITARTFARFRWSTTSGLNPTIDAPDGEVEDYAISVQTPPIYACQAEVDIWYGNDESGSVDATEFQEALDFIYQVSDQFYHSSTDGAKSGIVGWAFDADPVDVVMPITDTFNDTDDAGLATTGTTVDGDGNGVRENYTAKVSASTGTHLEQATQGIANRINAGNGRRTGVPQVAVILTDAPADQINNPANGGTTQWEAAAANLRAAGPDGTRIVLVLLAEAADAYDNDPQARATIDNVVGSDGFIVKTGSYGAVANPVNGFIASTAQAICDAGVFVVSEDYSDAPTSGTAPNGISIAAYGDATHTVDPSILLGAANDAEPDSIASANADGDGVEDDGVLGFATLVTTDSAYSVNVSATNGTGSSATLHGWIDFDGNGSFDSDEYTSTIVPDGSSGTLTALNWSSLPGIVSGTSFARFRLTTATLTGADAVKPASDGEVEDYTLVISDGPRDAATLPGLCSGFTSQGWITAAAPDKHDDAIRFNSGDPADDPYVFLPIRRTAEGRIETFFGTPDESLTGEVPTPAGSNLVATLHTDAGHQSEYHLNVFRVEGASGTTETISYNTFAGAEYSAYWLEDSTGNVLGSADFVYTWASGGGVGESISIPVTYPADGIVYIHAALFDPTAFYGLPTLDGYVCPVDYGDAPPSYGDPSHEIDTGIRLGATVTKEGMAYGDANANGDLDDGVTLPANLPVGGSGVISVSVVGAGAGLNAWIDWNGSGTFDGAVEHVARDLVDGDGDGTISFAVTAPANATTARTFARFRWSTDFSIGPDGFAPDGEVEDYALTLGGGGTVLSGRVFLDTGAGGGTAHNAVVDGLETGTPRATVSVFETGGNTLIATGTIDGQGNWSARLPDGFGGEVRLVTTPEAGLRTISEQVGGLPGLDPANNPNDGMIVFTPVSGSTYAGIDLGLIPEPLLSQDQVTSLTPGQVALLPHSYVATTGGSVQFSLAGFTSNPAGAFSTTLFVDTGCDGTPDVAVSGPVTVSAGQTICLLARTQASNGISATASATYDIQAVTSFVNTVLTSTLVNTDTINGGAAGEMVLRKLVRNTSQAGSQETTQNSGNIGDILRYRIIMSNPGSNPASNLSVFDNTPAYTALDQAIVSPVAVSSGVTCTLVIPAAGSNLPGYRGPLEWTCPGQFAAGETGSVTFDVTILP